jgi:hypothetical protein
MPAPRWRRADSALPACRHAPARRRRPPDCRRIAPRNAVATGGASMCASKGIPAWLPLVAGDDEPALAPDRHRHRGPGDVREPRGLRCAGGFPDIPLMEDIDFSAACASAPPPPACGKGRDLRPALGPARRLAHHRMLMWWLRLRFFLGADPPIASPVCTDMFRAKRRRGRSRRNRDPGQGPGCRAGEDPPDSAAGRRRRGPPAALAAGAYGRDRRIAADLGPVVLWCAGPPDHPDFADVPRVGKVSLHAQPEGDIGVRMLAAAAAKRRPACWSSAPIARC